MSLANGRCDQCGAATNTAGTCRQCERRTWSINVAPPAASQPAYEPSEHASSGGAALRIADHASQPAQEPVAFEKVWEYEWAQYGKPTTLSATAAKTIAYACLNAAPPADTARLEAELKSARLKHKEDAGQIVDQMHRIEELEKGDTARADRILLEDILANIEDLNLHRFEELRPRIRAALGREVRKP